jgi:hypothetical protein
LKTSPTLKIILRGLQLQFGFILLLHFFISFSSSAQTTPFTPKTILDLGLGMGGCYYLGSHQNANVGPGFSILGELGLKILLSEKSILGIQAGFGMDEHQISSKGPFENIQYKRRMFFAQFKCSYERMLGEQNRLSVQFSPMVRILLGGVMLRKEKSKNAIILEM